MSNKVSMENLVLYFLQTNNSLKPRSNCSKRQQNDKFRWL